MNGLMGKYETGLTDGQRAAFEDMVAGEDNIFLSGDAGTGKSFLLSRFIDYSERTGKAIVSCAPTGIAALNLKDGSTIHRAFGFKFKPIYHINDFFQPNDAIAMADIIIIDEISMCRIDLFHQVAKTIVRAKSMNGGKKPQLVVVGDFFQLPPVVRDEDEEILKKMFLDFESGFAFEDVEMWEYFSFKNHMLTEVVRQDSANPKNKEFKDMLTKARYGDRSCIPYFNKRVNARVDDPIKLVPTNRKASVYNEHMLSLIDGQEVTFTSRCEGDVNESDKAVDDVVKLVIGAKVMILVNDRDGYYQNGTMGTVSGFGYAGRDRTVFVEVEQRDMSGGVRHYEVEIEPHTWEILKPVVKRSLETVEKEIIDDDGQMKTVVEEKITSHIEHETVGRYTQIPIKLAYAITIHKSQGQTMSAVKIDPAVFSDGMLYVALSRCSSIDGLSLTAEIDPKKLTASNTAKDFYKRV